MVAVREFGALLAGAMLAAAAASAQRPPPLPPGSWNVDWGDQRCSLIRQSETSPPNFFALQVIPGSYRSDLRVVSRNWPGNALSDPERLVISFQPQGIPVAGQPRLERTEAGHALVIGDAAEDVREALAAAQSVRVTRDGASLVEIPLPSSRRALDALRECEATGMRRWGVDPAAHAAVTVPPRGYLAAYVSDNDYPESALRSDAQGTVIFRLDLDNTGRPTACTVLVSSGHDGLDSATCRIMRARARLTPALGPDGSSVPATIVSSIIWRIIG